MRGHGARKRIGGGQNAAVVDIALWLKMRHRPIGIARHDHRAFLRQQQSLLQHARRLSHIQPCLPQRVDAAYLGLTFAVVAQACCFENCRKQAGGRLCHIVGRGDDAVRCAGHATAREMLLFQCAVLRNGYCGGWRRHGLARRQILQRGGGHVLEFGGNGVTGIKQLLPSAHVVIGGHNLAVAGLACRTVGGRVEHHGAVAHALGSMHQHAPQLPAAQHAQRGGLVVVMDAGVRRRLQKRRHG